MSTLLQVVGTIASVAGYYLAGIAVLTLAGWVWSAYRLAVKTRHTTTKGRF